MKYLFILLLLFNFSVLSVSQVSVDSIDRPKNNFSAGLLGDVSFLSLAYERMWDIDSKFLFVAKVGLGYTFDFRFCIFSEDCVQYDYLTLPIHVTSNFGREKYFLECGLGSTFVYNKYNSYLFLYPILGVRFIPFKSNRINFRIFGHLPISFGEKNYVFASRLGINLGFSF